MRILLLSLFFIAGLTLISKSQNNCEQNLKQAEELYKDGDYDNGILILEKLFTQCSFSNKKKEEALELLTKFYLEQDNLKESDVAMRKLLDNNPHYEIKEIDSHEDFNILLSKFVIHPLLTIGIRNAALETEIKIIKTYSILDNIDYNYSYKTTKTIPLYHLWAEYQFKKKLAIAIDFINFNLMYKREFSDNSDWTMNFNETLSFIEIPVNFKKYFFLGKNIIPYASLGLGYLRIAKAQGNADIKYTKLDFFNGESTAYNTNSGNMDLLEMRNKNNCEILAGAGIGYKFMNLGIFIDARYSKGLNSLTNSSKRFNNSTLINDYYYIDNSIKLNKYELGISISYTFVNSIKKYDNVK